jgi:hypothetical protein
MTHVYYSVDLIYLFLSSSSSRISKDCVNFQDVGTGGYNALLTVIMTDLKECSESHCKQHFYSHADRVEKVCLWNQLANSLNT